MNERKRHLEDEITKARNEVLDLVAGLKPGHMDQLSNAGWSVKDMLAHLSSIEARLRSMWQHAVEGREWPAAENSVDEYNARCIQQRRSWPPEALVAELRQSGEETLQFARRLTPEDLDRQFNHPTRGLVTVETLMWIVPRHMREHAAEIKAATAG